MTEYVEREEAVEALNSEGITKNMRAHRKILAIPAADVAEVRHGKWVLKDDNGNGVCNQCNRQDQVDPLATHCRYCGAKMDGESK